MMKQIVLYLLSVCVLLEARERVRGASYTVRRSEQEFVERSAKTLPALEAQ